jgi:hypothetical protein
MNGAADAIRATNFYVQESTFSVNVALERGTFLNGAGGYLGLVNTTFSRNRAPVGGGIHNDSGIAVITYATFFDNGENTLFNRLSGGSSAFAVDRSIVYNGAGIGCTGDSIAGEQNILFPAGGCLAGNGRVADPLLLPIADNGGVTRTHMPMAGSPAIDSVTCIAEVLQLDQRQVARPFGPRCDAGAVEFDLMIGMGALESATATPVVLSSVVFVADTYVVNAGECTTLRWQAENISSATLDGAAVTPVNAQRVCPPQRTTYQLDVVFPDGTTQPYTVTIDVIFLISTPTPGNDGGQPGGGGTVNTCGDGICQLGSDTCACTNDCANDPTCVAPAPVCGNNICEAGEDNVSVPGACCFGDCPSVCPPP